MKTSTGYAAGGIRTKADVEEMIAAGATRIGASAGVKIVSESGDGQIRIVCPSAK